MYKRQHIDGGVWHLDVGSSHPGAGEGPKGWAVRPLKWHATDTSEGRQYLNWMNLSMEFARENREKMMLAVKAVLEKWIGREKRF